MDWCSVYLTPQGLPKYIYLSPPLIFPTTYNEIRTKNRPVWITPGAAPLSWTGPNRNPRWSKSGLRVTLSYLGVDGFKIYESFSDSDKLLKIWFSLFKMFKKEDLNSEFIVQFKRKCFSPSIHLQCEHKRCSLGIFKCLPFSINSLCSLILSFVISFLYSKFDIDK